MSRLLTCESDVVRHVSGDRLRELRVVTYNQPSERGVRDGVRSEELHLEFADEAKGASSRTRPNLAVATLSNLESLTSPHLAHFYGTPQ